MTVYDSLRSCLPRSKKVIQIVTYCLVAFAFARPAHADMITPGQVLSINFDILPTGYPAYDPNLVFLEFRGGVTFSSNAVATASLFVDGAELGSTTGDNLCSLCASTSWQFASAGFPDVWAFPNPTIVDFTSILNGGMGLITLTVDSGSMEFGDPPYTSNAPLVVFDSIASCGFNCTAFRGVTMDVANQTYEVTPAPVPEPASLFLLLSGLGVIVARRQRLTGFGMLP
jgi:hypothetical protein